MSGYYEDDSSDDNEYDEYDESGYSESGSGDEDEDHDCDWTSFRAVAVKSVRVHDGRGGARTVLAAIAIADPRPWTGGGGGDAVVFWSLANGGRVVPNGGLSGAPLLTLEDLADAPDLSDVVAAAAPLLRGCTLVAHQPSLVLRLLGMSRNEVSGIVDLSSHSPSLKDALIDKLNYGADVVPAKWRTVHIAVTMLQLAFMYQCPAPNLDPDYDTELLDDYAYRLIRYFGPALHWVSFSTLGGRDGCPMPSELRCNYTYPQLFSQHLFHLFEHDYSLGVRQREEQRSRPTSLTRRVPTPEPEPEPAPPPPPVAAPSATTASMAGDYEAALVGYLSHAGWVALSTVGQDMPIPRGLAPLGQFMSARPELFRRDGRFVCLVDDAEEEDHAPMANAGVLLNQSIAEEYERLRRGPVQQPPPAPAPATEDESDQEPPLGQVEEGQACAVCLQRRKVGAFIACMHKCCCMPCGNRVMADTRQCPICREQAIMFKRVFD